MIWKTLGYQIAATMVVVAVVVLFARWNENGPGQSRDSHAVLSVTGADSAAHVWSPGPEGDSQENAAHHWQKHGSEFPELHSEADYVAAAYRFVSDPPSGALTKEDSRGDTLIYDPQTNTFAVRAPDGAPRTMFRPSSGRAYWERQE